MIVGDEYFQAGKLTHALNSPAILKQGRNEWNLWNQKVAQIDCGMVNIRGQKTGIRDQEVMRRNAFLI